MISDPLFLIIFRLDKLCLWHLAGIIETNCSPFLACLARDCELKSYKSCTVIFPSVWSSEMICIANSI